jgi:hypothetical protein
MVASQENPSGAKRGALERYFLRRLAIAHRVYGKPRVRYANALADTILVFIAAPAAGILTFILILSLSWAPNPITRVFGISPQLETIVGAAALMFIGHRLLNKQMRNLTAREPDSYLLFSTARDGSIVFWQKTIVLVVSGILLPSAALLLLSF